MKDSRLNYAEFLLQETREDLGVADTKIAVLLSTVGIIASIVAGGIAAGHWSPMRLVLWAEVIWWLGIAIASTGIVALASALAPRVRHPESKFALSYFGHAAQFDSFEEFLDTLDQVSGQTKTMTASQLWLVSKILVRKYSYIRFALMTFGVGAVLLITAAAAG